MFQEITIGSKYYYHNLLSIIMLFIWIFIAIKGYRLISHNDKRKISIWIITICILQESLDFINRIFLDKNYFFSIQNDLPLLQFCTSVSVLGYRNQI